MNKKLKTGLIVVVALVALFVAAVGVLVATVDPNAYKAEIAQAVEKATGRELVFEGDIGLHVFPWLGLELGPVALGNAPGFEPKEMVRVNRAMASIRILPLLAGDLVVGEVVLDGFTLNLAVNGKGVSNWADLTGKGGDAPDGAADVPSPATEPESGKSGKPMGAISVQGVRITGAQVNYADARSGRKASISDLNLTIGAVGDRLTTPFELTFALKLDQPKIDVRPKVVGLAAFDRAKESFDLTDLVLELYDLRATGFLYARDLSHDINYSGELRLGRMNPRDLLAKLGLAAPDTADPKALTSAEAALKVDGRADRATLESLTARLDDTNLTASGAVVDFAAPAVTAEINVDDLDADRYLPPASTKKAASSAEPAATAPAASAGTPAAEPDLSALRSLNLSAKLTVGKLKAMNLRVSNVLVRLLAQNGVVKVDPFSADLYKGTLKGRSELDARAVPAPWKESAELRGVQAGPLLEDLTGKARIQGDAVAKYDVVGAGLTPANIKKTVSGTASFAFTDGAINGVNVAKMLRDAWARLKGQSVSADEPEKTDFAELLGSAVIKNGHIVNDDLLMKSPLLRVNGKGWADLPQNGVDYLATVTVVGTLKGQDGASIEELTGLPLPIRVKGSLNDPNISLDAKALADALFKGTFKKGAKSLEQNLKDSLLKNNGETGSTGSTDTEKKQTPGSLLKKLFK